MPDSTALDPTETPASHAIACRRIKLLEERLARKSEEIARLKKVLRMRKFRLRAPARRELLEREAGAAVVRPFLTDHYQQLGVEVIRRDLQFGLATLLAVGEGMISMHVGDWLLKRAEAGFPNLRCSPARAFVEGKLTGGNPPLPDLRPGWRRVSAVLLALDLLETIAFETERERLGVRGSRDTPAQCLG